MTKLLNFFLTYFFLKTTDFARWRDCYELCQLACKYCGYKTPSLVKYSCKLFVSKMFPHYSCFWPDMVSNWVKQKVEEKTSFEFASLCARSDWLKKRKWRKLSKNDCDSLARIFQFSIRKYMFRVIVGRFISQSESSVIGLENFDLSLFLIILSIGHRKFHQGSDKHYLAFQSS